FGVHQPSGSMWSMQPMFQFYLAAILAVSLTRATLERVRPGRPGTALPVGGILCATAVASAVYYGACFSDSKFIAEMWGLPLVAWMMITGMLAHPAAVHGEVKWLVVCLTVLVLVN